MVRRVRRAKPFALSALVLFALVLASVVPVYAVSQECRMIDPTWAVPAVVLPGETFTIALSKPVEVVEVVATNGTYEFKLQISSISQAKLLVKVPEDVAPGLYDIIVYYKGGMCGQHNALWVLSEPLNRLVIMHVSDDHFGVFNPTGRLAREYTLAATILAMSNPNITIVMDTGDLADTATVEQYTWARLVYGLLTKPVFVIPGNHDHVTGDENYRDYVGPLHWTRTIGPNILVVGLDTGYEGYIGFEQAKWAKNVIESSNAPIKIVLHHHPLFCYVYGDTPHEFKVSSSQQLLEVLESKKPGSKYPYIYTSWLENREGLKTLIDAIYNGKVTLSLSGHIHLDSYTVIERPDGSKTWFIVTTTLGGPIRQGDYHGFRIVVVEPNKVLVEGKGRPWDRHASYNIEGVEAHLTVSDNAVAVSFKVESQELLKLLPRLVLAVPVPKDYKGYKVYAPGFEKTWKRCTPVYCALYALASHVELNKTYRLAVYIKPDREPPKITVVSAPEKVEATEPITIEFTVTDDSWGVESVYVTIKGPGINIRATPARFDNMYKVSLPPLGEAGKLEAIIVATDAYGHTSVEKVEIEIAQPQEATTTPKQQTETATIPAQTPSKTQTRTQPAEVETTTTTTPMPLKTRARVPTVDYTVIVLAVVVGLVAALAVYLVVSRKA